jgi:TPR repeat protein
MRRVIVGILLVSSLFAGEFDKAMEAYKKGSFIEALNGFYILAKNGDAKAQFNVGLMYANGQGGQKDIRKAMSWYEKAAQQDLASAQYNLATLYQAAGELDPHAYKKAAYWYEKAANNGVKQAFNNLAALYLEGKGVKKDAKKALMLFEKAADMGDANAQLNCGIRYAWGEQETVDKLKAYEYLQKALASGKSEAGKHLEKLCKESSWVCGSKIK